MQDFDECVFFKDAMAQSHWLVCLHPSLALSGVHLKWLTTIFRIGCFDQQEFILILKAILKMSNKGLICLIMSKLNLLGDFLA